ncbi:MAG: hypothetical protein ACTTGJ_01880 [Clostridium sp.]
MKKCKKNTNKNNGITLIALVLTIIVLLILAGVALSLALGQNGLIFKSRESKQEQEIAQEKDRIMTAYSASFTNKDGKFNKVTFKDELDKQGIGLEGEINVEENGKLLKFKTKNNGYTVEYEIDDGRIERKLIVQNQSSESGIQVGDIITYDPTKGVSEQSKLTYTSQKGTAKICGNGYGVQTVTAKANNNKWVVISTANNQIKVMSKEPLGDVVGGDNNIFTLHGGIGWLYAEEELHKACSIYGHGKGAVPTNTTYQVGNKYIGEAKTRTLNNSGARSIIMEDVVKIMKGEEHTDFTDDEKNYFDDEHHYKDPAYTSKKVYYPTINSFIENAISITKRSFDNEHYDIHADTNGEYDKELVVDSKVKANKEKLKNHIFKSDWYWICSRFVGANSNTAFFNLYAVGGRNINNSTIFSTYANSLFQDIRVARFLRPVVYLDGSMLEKVSDGEWKIKD